MLIIRVAFSKLKSFNKCFVDIHFVDIHFVDSIICIQHDSINVNVNVIKTYGWWFRCNKADSRLNVCKFFSAYRWMFGWLLER